MDKVTYVSRKVMDRYHEKWARRLDRLSQRIQRLEAKLQPFLGEDDQDD